MSELYVVTNYKKPMGYFNDWDEATKMAVFINSQGGNSFIETEKISETFETLTVHTRVMTIPDDLRWRTPRKTSHTVPESAYISEDGILLTPGKTYWSWVREPGMDFGVLEVFGTDIDQVNSTLDVLIESLRTEKTSRKELQLTNAGWVGRFDVSHMSRVF